MAQCAAGLANAVLQARPEAAVAFFGPQDMDPDLFEPGVALFRYRTPQELSWRAVGRLARLPWLARRLRQDILAWRPTVLHVNSGHLSYPLFVPGLAARIPMVSSIHDIFPHLGERRPVERFKLSSLLGHSRRFLVHGRRLKEQAVARWRIDPERIEVFPIIKPSRIRSWAAAAEEQPFDILLFGRIHAYKGVGLILEALPEIVKRVPQARLIIAGKGDLDAWSASLESVRGHVELHNRFIPDREMAAFFRRCALAVLPYLEASQSGIEPVAACFGKPVVATRVGSLDEVVEDGRTGRLVPPGDAGALALAVATLLADPALRREMGRRAFERRYGPGVEKELGERLCRLYAAAV